MKPRNSPSATMDDPRDERAIVRQLTEAGMAAAVAGEKAALFVRAVRGLEGMLDGSGNEKRSNLPSLPDPLPFTGDRNRRPYLVFVPGRIEVLGKHTDYAGGRSLLATVERGFCVAATARQDATIRLLDPFGGETASFEFSPDLTPTIGHWSNYPMTVARRLARNFTGPLHGADIVFLSDLPPAAGMSSSSAMMIAVFKVLAHVNQLANREVYREHLAAAPALAAYLATIENGKSYGPLAGDRGVGTFGGSEDHTAICCCQPGRLHLFSFCPARLEQVIPLPAEYAFAIASSGVLAEKTGEAMAKYNRASKLVSTLLELWNSRSGRVDTCLADAVRSVAEAPEQLRRIVAEHPHTGFDAPSLLRRLDQFLGENEQIIPQAALSLMRGDIDSFGEEVDRSQKLTEDLLQNQVPQTVHLAHSARKHGASAASAFGAGFGGSVWALVEKAHADSFLTAWADGYRSEFPAEAERASFFLSGAGTGLVEIVP